MKENTTSRYEQTGKTKNMAVIGLMTAVICIIAPFSIPIPVSPVPISLTNFIIFMAVYILGMKSASICVILYLLLGAAGLPVFSSFSGGLAKLAGPTGGYLAGFILLAFIHGFFLEHFPGKKYTAILGMILGMAVCYTFGTAWLAWQTSQSFTTALTIGVLPYLPGDAVKIIIAAITGPKLRTAARIQRS
ncbi:MAG TPA: biotin transporter BioY [Candidatus Mediterraneibacter gallistercoris]|uniref:Biotin transporter n=1 Tax=Candidatus Mediterraneibacter gallistercoris TaxID=2838671 RepID=A0A9D2T309_9FIRM|nr:biotin transporter BioY [Candidatus Mediterraneibacter gallistercoris]